jgi:hypothetical protein
MNKTEKILAAAYNDTSDEPRAPDGKWTTGGRHSGAYQSRKDAPRKNGAFAPKPKPQHDKLVRNEVAVFDDKRKTKTYRTHILEHIAKTHSKVHHIPLRRLIDAEGEIPGQSVDTDHTKKFKDHVKGLDLKAYFDGKYPPVLMIQQHGDLRIINGRHRTVNLLDQLKEAGHDVNSPKAKIRARILNLDDPKIANLVKQAIHQNTDHSQIHSSDLEEDE